MTKLPGTNVSSALRFLPSIDELLETEEAREAISGLGRNRAAVLAREVTEEYRIEIRQDPVERLVAESSKEAFLSELSGRLRSAWRRLERNRLRRVINATGVIVHTNLGRAPLSEAAVKALADEASGFCTLEYDVETGQRGRRGAHAERLVAELTGAESALIVNNCAAAALLVLTVLASGREVIVSRGELVEIGGDFRIPDVLAQSGAILREVGTTNRTKIADYERALYDGTGLLLKVHPSNYRIVGFTETPPLSELAALARRKNLPLYEDAGSGAIADLRALGLADEPCMKNSVASGADVVTFSGDKLLGGPQAGIIVGRGDLIEQLRKHPLYRALRADKLVYAALAATLDAYARGTSIDEVPVLRMLRSSREELAERVRKLVSEIRWSLPEDDGMILETIDGASAVGGGAAPAVALPTTLIAISHATLSATEIEHRLRASEPPVIARIADDKVLIDLRTVSAADQPALLRALKSINQDQLK